MVEIKWLRSAKQDLNQVFEYISQDSPRYAALQLERIFLTTNQLKNNPDIGKIVPELQDSRIREIQEGNYRIIYRRISENSIHILMVHHSARDLGSRI